MGRKMRVAVCAIILLVANGCADLQAVRDFAKASSGLTAYDQATNDFGLRFDRTEIYIPPSDRARSKASSAERERALPDLVAVHKSLDAYLQVLGKLAGADTFDVSASAGRLQSAISANAFGINSDTAAAYGSLGQIIARWALVGVQQHYVSQLVTEADPHVQELIAGMRRLTARYKADLADENRDVIAVYQINREFLRDAPSGGSARDKLLAVVSADHFAAMQKGLDARSAKLDQLDQALTKIGEGHAALRVNVNNLSKAEFIATLKAIADDISKVKSKLEKLS